MLQALLPILGPVVEKLVAMIPDPQAREKARAEAISQLLAAAQIQDAQQVEIDKIEAQSPDRFVSGWRPFIGWVCGAALAYTYLLVPLLAWTLTLWSPGTSLPHLPTDNLFELVLAMLGLGGLRTFEKIKKVAR
ncbi:MAG: hypothetical protein IPI58_05805 [Alphaproteobacteria bacterium]|nr:MAG: hypothetical protein IPI58_05805 [Alphaproteobacteria bacterium]